MPVVNRSFSMKSRSQRDWYRIENLHVDEANSSEDKAVVYIYDEIGESFWGDATSASDFVKNVSNLNVSEIELHLNSPGGSIFDGIAIYQALKAHKATVTVYIDALAASAASFIAMSGDKIVMTEAATMMIHDGSGLAWGTAADLRSTADLLDKLSNTVAGIYARRAGNSEDFWRALMVEEVWYNAKEAVDAGLADSVGGATKPKDEEDATNKWDLSIFNYSGRASAPSPFDVRNRIANQFINKENAVTKPRNSADTQSQPDGPPQGTPETVNPASPDVNPETPTTGDSEEPTPASEPNTEGTPSEPTPNAPGAPQVEPGAPPTNSLIASGTQVVMIGDQGIPLSDLVNQFTTLKNFHDEAIVAGKKAFVKQLHDEGRITGPQVTATENFALGLSDEQYDAWKATWEGASGVPMLNAMPGGTSNHDGNSTDVANKEAEIERCKSIVRSFKQSNMKEEAIKNTPSYQTLIALDPNFHL